MVRLILNSAAEGSKLVMVKPAGSWLATLTLVAVSGPLLTTRMVQAMASFWLGVILETVVITARSATGLIVMVFEAVLLPVFSSSSRPVRFLDEAVVLMEPS